MDTVPVSLASGEKLAVEARVSGKYLPFNLLFQRTFRFRIRGASATRQALEEESPQSLFVQTHGYRRVQKTTTCLVELLEGFLRWLVHTKDDGLPRLGDAVQLLEQLQGPARVKPKISVGLREPAVVNHGTIKASQ
jgi:hypothetical protein